MMKKRRASESLDSETTALPATTMTDYEKERRDTLERNAMKFQELGLHTLANQLREKTKTREPKGKLKLHSNMAKDPEYRPDIDDVRDDFSDEEAEDAHDKRGSTISKKAMKVKTNGSMTMLTRQKKRSMSSCPAMSMDDFIAIQQQKEPTTGPREVQVQRYEIEPDSSVDYGRRTEPPIQPQNADDYNKNYRGPTMLFDVHARKLEDCKVITFNEKNQPIGHDKKALDEFSRFLGTIATDYNWVPLTFTNWHKVPDKNMWEYVNSKYIIPPSAEEWVMESICASWRGFKCRIKKHHFYKYETDEERWKNRPKDRVPDSHFETLLKYWNLPLVQTAEERKPPSKVKMFEETRKRREGCTYKLPYDDTSNKINEED